VILAELPKSLEWKEKISNLSNVVTHKIVRIWQNSSLTRVFSAKALF
jgi:hypothetical protein